MKDELIYVIINRADGKGTHQNPDYRGLWPEGELDQCLNAMDTFVREEMVNQLRETLDILSCVVSKASFGQFYESRVEEVSSSLEVVEELLGEKAPSIPKKLPLAIDGISAALAAQRGLYKINIWVIPREKAEKTGVFGRCTLYLPDYSAPVIWKSLLEEADKRLGTNR